MDVPVQACAGWKIRVYRREEPAGEDGRYVSADKMVGEGGEEQLMDMYWEGREGEVFCERGYCLDEEGGRRDGEWVVHVNNGDGVIDALLSCCVRTERA